MTNREKSTILVVGFFVFIHFHSFTCSSHRKKWLFLILFLLSLKMKLSKCETIIDEKKFLESHLERERKGGKINEPYIERLNKYRKIKDENYNKK